MRKSYENLADWKVAAADQGLRTDMTRQSSFGRHYDAIDKNGEVKGYFNHWLKGHPQRTKSFGELPVVQEEIFNHSNISKYLVSLGYEEIPFDTKMYRWCDSLDYSFNKRVFVQIGFPRILVVNTCYSHYIDPTEMKIIKKIWFSEDKENAEILRNADSWKGIDYMLGDLSWLCNDTKPA